jgi:hypothetical protein
MFGFWKLRFEADHWLSDVPFRERLPLARDQRTSLTLPGPPAPQQDENVGPLRVPRTEDSQSGAGLLSLADRRLRLKSAGFGPLRWLVG